MNVLYVDTVFSKMKVIKNTDVKPVSGDKAGLAGYTPLPVIKDVILHPDKNRYDHTLAKEIDYVIDVIAFY